MYELYHELQNDVRLRILTPRHFRRWGGLVPTQEKRKKTSDLKNFKKISKLSIVNSDQSFLQIP